LIAEQRGGPMLREIRIRVLLEDRADALDIN
jgi:hypothetical protein